MLQGDTLPGTPTSAASYTFTITVASAGQSASQENTVVISNTSTDTSTDTNTNTDTHTNTDTNGTTDTNTDTSTDTNTDTNTDTTTPTDTTTQTETGTDTDTGGDTETITETGTSTETETGTDAETENDITATLDSYDEVIPAGATRNYSVTASGGSGMLHYDWDFGSATWDYSDSASQTAVFDPAGTDNYCEVTVYDDPRHSKWISFNVKNVEVKFGRNEDGRITRYQDGPDYSFMPPSITPGREQTVEVIVIPSIVSTGYAIKLDFGDLPAQCGTAAIVGVDTIYESGSVKIRGCNQTELQYDGRLLIRARLMNMADHGSVEYLAASQGFSVCAHPQVLEDYYALAACRA